MSDMLPRHKDAYPSLKGKTEQLTMIDRGLETFSTERLIQPRDLSFFHGMDMELHERLVSWPIFEARKICV